MDILKIITDFSNPVTLGALTFVTSVIAGFAIKFLKKKSVLAKHFLEQEITKKLILEASALFGTGKGSENSANKHAHVRSELIDYFPKMKGKAADTWIKAICVGLKKGIFNEISGKKNNISEPDKNELVG